MFWDIFLFQCGQEREFFSFIFFSHMDTEGVQWTELPPPPKPLTLKVATAKFAEMLESPEHSINHAAGKTCNQLCIHEYKK
jgi:hypothetical protein